MNSPIQATKLPLPSIPEHNETNLTTNENVCKSSKADPGLASYRPYSRTQSFDLTKCDGINYQTSQLSLGSTMTSLQQASKSEKSLAFIGFDQLVEEDSCDINNELKEEDQKDGEFAGKIGRKSSLDSNTRQLNPILSPRIFERSLEIPINHQNDSNSFQVFENSTVALQINLENQPETVEIPSPVQIETHGLSFLLPELEAKMFIQRRIVFLVFMALYSIYFLLMSYEKASPQGLLDISLIFIAYHLTENIVRIRIRGREKWQKREDLFSIVDCANALLIVTSIYLKITHLILISLVACGPFIVTGAVYYVLSEAPKTLKIVRAIHRCFYGAQAFLIVAQLNGVINVD